MLVCHVKNFNTGKYDVPSKHAFKHFIWGLPLAHIPLQLQLQNEKITYSLIHMLSIDKVHSFPYLFFFLDIICSYSYKAMAIVCVIIKFELIFCSSFFPVSFSQYVLHFFFKKSQTFFITILGLHKMYPTSNFHFF